MGSPSGAGDWELILEPGRSGRNYWRDFWRFRELFVILSWRDLKVRYKQTFLGVAWSIIRPVLATVIFTILFGKVAKFDAPASGVPYALLVFAGMLPWQFFSNAIAEGSNSLVGNASLVTKVYFPRMMIPLSAVVTCLVDLGLSFLVLLLMFLWYRIVPSWQILFLPAFVVLAFACAASVSIFLAALTVRYRDFRFILPFVVQFGLYVSPVGFSSAVVAKQYRFFYAMNPMVGIIDGFRWSLLNEPINGFSLAASLAVTVAVLWVGVSSFRSFERTFADEI